MKLKSLGTLLLNITFCLAATSDVGVVNAQGTTESGIPLNAPWKRTIYDFAKTNLKHPAWGWAHSERDYQLALELARIEKLTVDQEILFAAAFLHDVGAIAHIVVTTLSMHCVRPRSAKMCSVKQDFQWTNFPP